MPDICTFKNASLFVLLAMFVSAACMRESGLSREYNFDFIVAPDGKLHRWLKAYRAIMTMKADSSQLVEGNPSLKIGPMKFLGRHWPLKANLQQRILVPRLAADSATIALSCKSQELEKAQLIVSGINDNEDRLYSSTLSCLSGNKWQTFSMTVPVKDAIFLHLELRADGRDTNAAWWLDRIRISMDGRDIGELSAFTGHKAAVLAETDIVPLSFEHSEPYFAIPELAGKKLVAIGESVHGSATVNKAAVQLIKHQVANNNARLVLLEMPVAQMLSYNRFIQGDENFKIDSLLIDYHHMFSKDQLIDLLMWLKNYNDSANEKVWLMGLDIDKLQMNSAMWLFDYLYALNAYQPHPIIDSLCAELVQADRSFETITRLLERNRDIEELIGKKEYRILKYCLEMNERVGSRGSRRFIIRDSIMFKNAEFLIDLLAAGTKGAVFYTHLGHSNYRTENTMYSSSSFGAYMKKAFADDYSNIGVLVGGGKALILEGDSLLEKQLPSPPHNSMEHLLSKRKEPYLYMPAVRGITQVRYSGLTYTPGYQFGTMVLQSRMDGMIFIRSSEAIVPEKADVSYLSGFPAKKFMRNLERNKQLQREDKQGGA